ncbi:MAG: ABC transporter permease subunit [Lentisphaeria bacterium]
MWWVARFDWCKLMAQRKSLAGLGVVLFVNLLFGVAFFMARRNPRGLRHDVPAELLGQVFNALTYALAILAPCLYLLFPMTLSVLVAHSFASEFETGAVRLLLARPTPRWKFLVGKWLALSGYALGMLALLLVTSYLVAACLFKGTGDLIVFKPLMGLGGGIVVHPWPAALGRVLLAYVLAVPMLAATVALALLAATLTRHFASAAILTTAVFFCSYVAENLPLLSDIRPYLPVYHMLLWKWAVAEVIPWTRAGTDLLWTAGYTALFLTGAAIAHTRRDV